MSLENGGWNGGAVVSTMPSQQEGSGITPGGLLGPFRVPFACSPRALVGFLWVLQLPPTVQRNDLPFPTLSLCYIVRRLVTCPECTPPLA